MLLERDEEHPEQPVVEVTDLGDALSELVAQTSFLHDQAAALRFIAALAAATGGIRTVKYREAATLPAVIAELVALRRRRSRCRDARSASRSPIDADPRIPRFRGRRSPTRSRSRTPIASRSSRSTRTGTAT